MQVAKGTSESSQPQAGDYNSTQCSIPDSMVDENWKTIDRDDDESKVTDDTGQDTSTTVLPAVVPSNQQHNQGRRHSRLSEFDLNTRRNLFARKVTSLIASGSSGVVSGDRATPLVTDSLQSDSDGHGMSLLPCEETSAINRSVRKSTSSVSSTQSYGSSHVTLRGDYSSDLSHQSRQLFHHAQPPPPYPTVTNAPKLTVTLPGNESGGSSITESAIESVDTPPITGRLSKSPKKKRRNHSKSGTRPGSRSRSRSPSKSPSPQSLNASVLIGLTQVRRSRNEWI